MPLETKHINALRSCSLWLKSRIGTWIANKFNWNSLLETYSNDLTEIADELEKMNLPKTVITLDQLFGKEDGQP